MPIYEVQSNPPEVLRLKGPCCPIDISLPQILIDQLTQQGTQIPPPVSGHALIDTGASISAIDFSVITSLQISPIGVINIGTAGGSVQTNLYPARFILLDLEIELGRVIGANLRQFNIIALIGRDMLSRFLMIYHGPAGRFTLSI